MNNHKINKLFFKSIILLICSYQLDINKNYKSYLSNENIKDCLKVYNVRSDIIFDVYTKYDLSGKFYYLRNKVDSECMILVRKKKLYLIFCGTQFDFNDKYSLIKDIITDIKLGLDIVQEFGQDIGIHHTYKSNMNNENLIGQIQNIVNKYKNHKVILCGHSMGCGLAVYTSMILSKEHPKKIFDLVLISAPKLGNINLSKYIEDTKNITLHSMINNKEIIPLFPFYPLFPSYKNIGYKTFKYNSNGIVEILDDVTNNIFKMSSIKDHFTNNIITNVYECMKK
jgi:hypothetical protein